MAHRCLSTKERHLPFILDGTKLACTSLRTKNSASETVGRLQQISCNAEVPRSTCYFYWLFSKYMLLVETENDFSQSKLLWLMDRSRNSRRWDPVWFYRKAIREQLQPLPLEWQQRLSSQRKKTTLVSSVELIEERFSLFSPNMLVCFHYIHSKYIYSVSLVIAST